VERVVLLVLPLELDFEPAEPPRLVPVARVVFGLMPVPARVVVGMEFPLC
jgi:hypothetical protein